MTPQTPRSHLEQKANLGLYPFPNHHSCVFMAPGELQSPQFWDCWTQKTPLLKVPSRWPLHPRPPDVHLGSHYFALCIILKMVPRVPCSVSATVPQSAFSHFSHGCFFSRMQGFSQCDHGSLHFLLLLKSVTSFPVLHRQRWCCILVIPWPRSLHPHGTTYTMRATHTALHSLCTMSSMYHTHTDLCPCFHDSDPVLPPYLQCPIWTYSAPHLQCTIVTLCLHGISP